jgi:hypothetical protein
MGALIDNVRTQRRHDPDERYRGKRGMRADPDELADSLHPMDTPENQAVFTRLWTWWVETRDLHYAPRQLRLRDHEMYDGRQWTPIEEQEIVNRGQEPLVFNLLKLMVDWVTGTERRTRIDWNVLPRSEEDVEAAGLKKQLLKYVSDVNKLGWQRSFAFKDAAISGVGWLEDCVVSAKNEEPCTSRYQDWKGIWWDAYSRDMMMRDCRFMFRRKWLDLDYACAMWPHREQMLRAMACTLLDPGVELLEDDSLLPALFAGTRDILNKAIAVATGRARQRVPIWEAWYLDPENKKTLDSVYGDEDPLHGETYDPAKPDHAAANDSPLYSLTEGVTDTMKLAFFCEGGLLELKTAPYKHNRFPFTPIWAYRDHLDGMPYGIVRQVIDPQRDYNKRRSKSLFLLTTNQKVYEAGAIDEASEDDVLDEADRPDGRIRLNKGALTNKAFEIRGNTDMAMGHVRLMEEDKENILETSGVTRENVGQSSNAVSGKAILAKQQQGAVSTAELFDNSRLSVQESGEKQLSNVEQFMSMPKKFRVLGPKNSAKWMAVNQPFVDPMTGQVLFNNDITAYSADFIVDQQDYRETVRMAQSETLFELIGNIAASAPNLAMKLLPMALDLTDIPNKAEMVEIARQEAGLAPQGEEGSDEAIAAQQAAEQAKADEAALQREERGAGVRLTHAKAAQAEADATNKTLDGKTKALDTAGIVHAVAPLAPAADRLFEGSKPTLTTSTGAP